MASQTNHKQMDPRSDTVRRYFDREAGRFPEIGHGSATLWQKGLTTVFRRSLRLRFQHVFEQIASIEGYTLLDVGCGSGSYAVHAASTGAARVVGIDFSSEMIRLARMQAVREEISDRCEFLAVDIFDYRPAEPFDFVVAMGVMDYIGDAARFLARVRAMARRSIFLSFPKSGGILAWQRQWHYRHRCPLFVYSRQDLERLLNENAPGRFEIKPAARDWFVTLPGEAT